MQPAYSCLPCRNKLKMHMWAHLTARRLQTRPKPHTETAILASLPDYEPGWLGHTWAPGNHVTTMAIAGSLGTDRGPNLLLPVAACLLRPL